MIIRHRIILTEMNGAYCTLIFLFDKKKINSEKHFRKVICVDLQIYVLMNRIFFFFFLLTIYKITLRVSFDNANYRHFYACFRI